MGSKIPRITTTLLGIALYAFQWGATEMKWITLENARWLIYGSYLLAFIAISLWVYYFFTKRKGRNMSDKDNEKTNIIKDSKFKAKVEKADKATVMDIRSPQIVDNVEASLEAKDVKDAAVIRTNQTLNIRMGECENCHRPLPSVSFGVRLSSITCRFCGHENKVNDNG